MHVPQVLRTSYEQATSYPLNLLHRSVDAARSRQYEQRLNNAAYRLCMDEPSEASNLQVSFRDWTRGNPDCNKQNVDNDVELADWLGDRSALLPPGDPFTRIDPLCRFIFLSAPSGRDALQLTTRMLQRILSYHQVPAQYLDFLFLFGERETASDLKFGTFWSNTFFGTPRPDIVSQALGRSGQHYEMCFNLKGAEPKTPGNATPIDLDQWSIRHTSVYHKFDVQNGCTVWMVTKAKWNLKDTFRDATGTGSESAARTFTDPISSYRSSLVAHILIARWAAEYWRPYLQCLEDSLEAKTNNAILSGGNTSLSKDDQYPIYTRSHVQEIIYYEELASQATHVLQTNVTVLQSLQECYQGLLNDAEFPFANTNDVMTATRSFTTEIHKIQTEMQSLFTRATFLVAHAMNRRQLVLNLMQAQNADNMTDMTVRSIQEAITMRIITVVTLIYLPATFVSTFFSTDVVKYQPSADGEPYHTQYSSLAMDRWLQVTLPLTLVTISIAIGLYLWAVRPLKKLEQSKV